jgi:uncharacterized MnhB-related membrane protein
VTVLQVIALTLIVVGSLAVVITPDPLRQTMVVGIYGIALTFLFFTFQAPDVALSQLVISTIGLPLIVFAALRKIRAEEKQYQERRQQESGE